MLVAVATLVLHGNGAAAGHRHVPVASECRTMVSAGHAHQEPHDPECGASHSLARDASIHDMGSGDLGSHDGTAGTDGASSCCASACPVGMVAFGPGSILAPMASGPVPTPASRDGASLSVGGPRRPPRTPGIA